MVVVLSIVVIVLCTRVVSFDSYDWLDLPELVSIYMEYDAFRFNNDSWDTLIMRSDERRMDWWSRFAEVDDSDWQSVQELHIQVSSSSCSWECFIVVGVKTRHAQFDSYWNAWLWVWLQEWCYDCWRWIIRVVLMSRHLCSSLFLQLIVVWNWSGVVLCCVCFNDFMIRFHSHSNAQFSLKNRSWPNATHHTTHHQLPPNIHNLTTYFCFHQLTRMKLPECPTDFTPPPFAQSKSLPFSWPSILTIRNAIQSGWIGSAVPVP